MLDRRKSLLADWRGPVVAITLSGGGYRAALTHAGVLWTLDQAGIPVHVLSTVSGGSIVGAAYAVGWTPERFRAYLAGTRPGLARDVLHVGHVLRGMIFPKRGSGETFAAHLARNYYADVALDESGPPALVVNTTRFDTGTRASFWPRSAPPVQDLAHLVAASGAFPGAFGPVYLADAPYVDGGVMENLGVEGLAQYLAGQPTAEVRTPGLLIVSDVSAEPVPPTSAGPPPFMSAVLRAQDLVCQQLHARIFSTYTGGAYRPEAPSRTGYEVPAERIWPGRTGAVRVFVLSPASRGERARLTDKTDQLVADTVAQISTLLEPSPGQVNAAFWLGAGIAREYLPAVCAAAGLLPCPEIALPERPDLGRADH